MVRGKFTLIGTDNNGFRHRHSIRKNEDFKKAFIDFMVNLDFEEEKIRGRFEYRDEETDKLIRVKIKNIEDVCGSYSNESYEVDVFYGRFKVIIVVRTKRRAQMVDHLVKKAKWIKPRIIRKIREGKKAPLEVTPDIKLRKKNDNA